MLSQSNGELEVMLHRRELQDDGLGACYHPNEPSPPSWKRPDGCPANRIPLNVSSRVYPRLWLVFGDIAVTNNATAMLSQAMNNPPLVLFGNASASAGLPSDTGSSQQAYQWVQHYGATPFRALSTSLPPEVLLTWSPRCWLSPLTRCLAVCSCLCTPAGTFAVISSSWGPAAWPYGRQTAAHTRGGH